MGLTKRQIAYKYLLEKRSGYRDELISVITDELFEEFCLIGFITEGMDGEWNERWRLTDFGESQITSHFRFIKVTERLKNLNIA